jgi:hypothetical protein
MGGYRSPEGHEIRQGHINRIPAGSWTCLQAREEVSQQAKEPAKALIPALAFSSTIRLEELSVFIYAKKKGDTAYQYWKAEWRGRDGKMQQVT